MVVQQLKPTDLQLPACFVYQSLSKELESINESKIQFFLSGRWRHWQHRRLVLFLLIHHLHDGQIVAKNISISAKMFVRRHYAFQLRLNSLYNSLLSVYATAPISNGITVPCRRLPTIMAALYYFPLFELSDKTSDAQAVIFTCRINNNSSNIFLLSKTVNTVK